MRKIAITPVLFLSAAAFGHPWAAPQSNVRHETIVRNDTVTRTDTVITTRKIKRTEVIQRVEEVFYSDSVALVNGQPVRQPETAAVPPVPLASPVLKLDPATMTISGSLPPLVAEMEEAPIENIAISPEITPADAVKKLPERPGGDYVWIPDTLLTEVNMLLSGRRSDSVDLVKELDHNERVTFRGDTINMVLRDRNFGRFDRGLFNYLFIPKGIWSIGVTASYGEFSTSDLEVLDLMSDIDFSGHIFSIRPYFSYFVGNNRSVGMRLGYSSGKAHIGSFKVDIDEDMNFNLRDISYRSESYTAAVTYNQYFGIARRGRFGIFNEIELAFSSGNSDFIRPYAGKLKTTHTNTMQAALNFSPGLSVYIMDPVTFNISFGVFGVHLRNEKQMVDGEDMGSRFTSGANFRFNIFNISFGVAVNL